MFVIMDNIMKCPVYILHFSCIFMYHIADFNGRNMV